MQISKLYGIHVKELLGLKENAERWPGLTRYSWFQPKTFVEVPALLPSEESTQEPEETATVGQPASSRWSDKEKEAFVRLIQQEVGRQTKPSLIPWTSMTSKFLELTGVQRSKESLRNFYQRHWNELGLPSPFSRSGGRGQPTDEKRAVAAGKTASRSKASRPTQKIAAAVVAAPAASEKKGPGTFGRAVAAGKTAPRATASRRRQKIGAAAAPASKTKGREKFGRAAATVAAAAAGITATASDKEEAKEMDRARYTVRSAQRYAAATAAAAAASESKKNKDVAMKRIAVAAAAAAATEKKKKKKKVTEMERAAAIVTAAAAASEKKKKKDVAIRTAAPAALDTRCPGPSWRSVPDAERSEGALRVQGRHRRRCLRCTVFNLAHIWTISHAFSVLHGTAPKRKGEKKRAFPFGAPYGPACSQDQDRHRLPPLLPPPYRRSGFWRAPRLAHRQLCFPFQLIHLSVFRSALPPPRAPCDTLFLVPMLI